MKTALLCVLLWPVAMAHPCVAQMMSAAQYHDYMKKLDATVVRWQRRVKSVDIDNMKVDYSRGKTIERARVMRR